MAYLRSAWLHWGVVCSVFTAVCARDSAWDCTDRDDVLRDMPADVSMPSECILDCTARTYRRVLQRTHDRLTIRFRGSRAVDPDEYCWSTRIQCSPGQRLQSAFILLPVHSSSGADRETLRLEMNGATLHQNPDFSLFPPECGLRFDVTDRVAAKEALCVKVQPQEQATLGLVCPPFLVTTWEKWNQG